jgi:hypothetical protein
MDAGETGQGRPSASLLELAQLSNVIAAAPGFWFPICEQQPALQLPDFSISSRAAASHSVRRELAMPSEHQPGDSRAPHRRSHLGS